MNKFKYASRPDESLFKGVMLAYFVLFLHVVLILGLGVLMLIFGGVIAHLPLILALIGALIIGSGYLWWRYMKKQGRKVGDMLKDPLFAGRTIEVSLLGGLASLKLGQSQEPLTIAHRDNETPKQLKDPGTDRAEQLANLARLLKEDVITIDEFLKAKKDIMGQ